MDSDDVMLRRELDSLESVAASASVWTSLDASGRRAYNSLSKRYSDEIWAQYKAGKLTAQQGAKLAQESRNEVMMAVRARSSPYGRERAKTMKARGRTLEELMEKYAREKFKKGFYELTEEQKGVAYEEIIRAAGRPSATVNAEARLLGKLSRGLWVVTAVVIIWDVSTSKNKVETAVRDLGEVAVGVLGSMAVGAAAGLVFGPIGALVGGVVGGILGGLIADGLFDYIKSHPMTPEEADAMLRSLP